MAINEIAKADSEKLLRKNIKAVAGSAVKLNDLIHNTAMQAAEHAKEYGDTNFCASLVDAMPMSHRRSLLISWFEAFSPIRVAKNNKSGLMKAHLAGKAEERDEMWQLDLGRETPFYSDAFTGGATAQEPDVPTLESITNNVVSFTKRLEATINGTPNKQPGDSGYKPGMPDGEEKQAALAKLHAIKTAVG
jgi:hypothetical protein